MRSAIELASRNSFHKRLSVIVVISFLKHAFQHARFHDLKCANSRSIRKIELGAVSVNDAKDVSGKGFDLFAVGHECCNG